MIAGMGTAPGNRQHPAMPDPKHVVIQSLTVLRHQGFDDERGLELIVNVATMVKLLGNLNGQAMSGWIDDVIAQARRRLAAPAPSPSQRTEIRDADGSRGRTGRNEENQQ